MNDKLDEFVGSLTYWLEQSHGITAAITAFTSDACELELTDEDGEEVYIGSYADPGLSIRWIGELSTVGYDGEPETHYLVMANNVPIVALGKHVAGWAAGLV